MPEATFCTVIRNSTWRSQVLQIQGYVPAKSVIPGEYNYRPKVTVTDIDTAETN